MTKISISIKDLVRSVLSEWKFIIILMLIGAIILDGYYYFSEIRSASSLSDKEEVEDIEDLKAVLSEREIYFTESAAATYGDLFSQYTAVKEYMNKSIMMKIDYTQVPTLRLEYFLDSHYSVEFPVMEEHDTSYGIAYSIMEVTKDNDLATQIMNAIGIDGDTSYAQELLSFDYSSGDVFYIKIVTSNQSDCEEVGELVKSAVEKRKLELEEQFGNFDLDLVSEQYIETVNSDILNLHTQQTNSLNNIVSLMNNLTSGFTDEQKNYYNALVDELFVEELEDESISDSADKSFEQSLVSIKHVILGMILGAFIAILWLILKYIFSSKVRTASDMAEVFQFNQLGYISTGKSKKVRFLSESFERFTRDEQIQMILAGVLVATRKNGYRDIFISGSSTSEVCSDLKTELNKLLREKGITTSIGGNLAYNAETVERMSTCDGIVLVEQVDFSLYEDIIKEKRLCEQYNIPIIGCVVVE